jgi:hypothetical protein
VIFARRSSASCRYFGRLVKADNGPPAPGLSHLTYLVHHTVIVRAQAPYLAMSTMCTMWSRLFLSIGGNCEQVQIYSPARR